jgi:hypothetical protein
MIERWHKKFVCFKKTCHGVFKKADTAVVSGTKVNYPLSPDGLVQLVDVSIASKYGTDLTQFMCVVAEDMRSTLDSFKQDLKSSLPRQVRAVV